MFSATFTFIDELYKVTQAKEQAAFKNVRHAAATVRNDAIKSIVPSPVASPAGTPPHTRNRVSRKSGKQLKGQLQRAIVFDYDAKEMRAVIGPRFSVVGESGKAHEFGGEYKGETYPERSFMGPAMTSNLDRFATDWRGSVGG